MDSEKWKIVSCSLTLRKLVVSSCSYSKVTTASLKHVSSFLLLHKIVFGKWFSGLSISYGFDFPNFVLYTCPCVHLCPTTQRRTEVLQNDNQEDTRLSFCSTFSINKCDKMSYLFSALTVSWWCFLFLCLSSVLGATSKEDGQKQHNKSSCKTTWKNRI